MIVASILVFVAGIVYAEVHGLTLLAKGVAADLLLWAYVGMVALIVTLADSDLRIHEPVPCDGARLTGSSTAPSSTARATSKP